MKPSLRNGLLLLVSVGMLVPGLIVYRNTQFEKGVSALKAGDYETTLRKLKPLAMLGDSDAQLLLGQMYAFGWGVPRSESDALEWLRRAGRWSRTEPDTGAVAAYFVGRDYAEGVGAVRKDELEAIKWFKIAANGGSGAAAKLLSKAYAEGLLGLPRDPKQSEYWANKGK